MTSQDLMHHMRSSGQDAGSWLEIDAAAFESNVRNLLTMIDDTALLCAVVKSNAYGHGAGLLLPSLVHLGVPFVGVGSNEEAAIARRCGFTGRILRVRAAAPQEIKAGLRHDIEELLSDPRSAWEMHKIAAEAGKLVRIHLDINSSGISRHSLDVSSALGRASAVAIVSHPGLQLAGIMTHFPKDDNGHIETALERFKSQALTLLHLTGTPREGVLLHCANSYAALHVRGSWLDMVRAGAVLYGDSDPRAGHFQRCLAFKARIASINSYAAGTKVGYGLTRTLNRDSKLATVTAGYGDGYRRALARQGGVLVRGRRAAIVDVVSMNSMVVDVTDVADVSPGDEVVLFGRQGSAEIAPAELEAANSAILADLYTVWAQGNRVLVNDGHM
ncbi:alanine racemase [Arthrobacter sp. H-02-3]|uniref:alanine racemase n=1 Tax=Arthrobacter sp. H-02-3 TaxID=2703675 RepID=UPI000DD1CB77|nr:alanine racemase [Arthrobacter sp. H-02-3]PVZ57998.1 alanine racemase [Arthrobacter sp. H-02-3]